MKLKLQKKKRQKVNKRRTIKVSENKIVVCEICNKKGRGKSMVVLEMDFMLKKQAKEIFKEIELFRRVGVCNDIQLEFTQKEYNKLRNKYMEDG